MENTTLLYDMALYVALLSLIVVLIVPIATWLNRKRVIPEIDKN